MGDAVLPANRASLSPSSQAKSVTENEAFSAGKRLRIHKASQTVEVSDVAASVSQAKDLVGSRDGYVENSSVSDHDIPYGSLTVRVPAPRVESLLDEFAALGRETSRRTSAEDTTDAYYDLQARIRNAEALRDRLRKLLDATDTISEILAIEKELARVQSELDAMRTRFQRMQSDVSLAKIELRLETPEIPGPVGAASKGFWWSFKKLFVLKPGSS